VSFKASLGYIVRAHLKKRERERERERGRRKEGRKEKIHVSKLSHIAGRLWWLMPVILAVQKAEIRRIVIQSQPRANSSQDPISIKLIKKKKGLPEGFKW
jgi:hypothetical protein